MTVQYRWKTIQTGRWGSVKHDHNRLTEVKIIELRGLKISGLKIDRLVNIQQPPLVALGDFVAALRLCIIFGFFQTSFKPYKQPSLAGFVVAVVEFQLKNRKAIDNI